jgi:glycosyltransferase involved in cell wall biosynthesis
VKILFISSLYATREISGAEKIVKILAEGAVRRGHEAVVLSLSLDGADHSFERGGVTVHQLKQQNIYSPWPPAAHGFASRAVWHSLDVINPLMIGRVGAVLDRVRPDVVHSHLLAGFTLAPWLAVKRRKLPLVHTMHDWYLRCINSAMYRRERMCGTPCAMCRAYRLPHRRVSASVDIPVGVSDFILRGHLQAGFFAGARAARVIHNSYDGTVGAPRAEPTSRPLRLGFLGRLSPAKGIGLFLETVRTLCAEGVEVVVGGSGAPEFEQGLRARFTDPRITFLGHTDPTAFFRRIDALVVPSVWHEPCPLVIFEAFGNGVPVIASRRGGNTELVEDGRTGYLFDPDQAGELAGIITRLVADPAVLDAMRPACIERARHYTNDRMIDAYLAVYREAAGARQ